MLQCVARRVYYEDVNARFEDNNGIDRCRPFPPLSCNLVKKPRKPCTTSGKDAQRSEFSAPKQCTGCLEKKDNAQAPTVLALVTSDSGSSHMCFIGDAPRNARRLRICA